MSLKITKEEKHNGITFKAGDKVYSKLANSSHRMACTIQGFWHWNMRLENTIEVHFEEMQSKWSMDALEHAPVWMQVDHVFAKLKKQGLPSTL